MSFNDDDYNSGVYGDDNSLDYGSSDLSYLNELDDEGDFMDDIPVDDSAGAADDIDDDEEEE